MVDIIRLRERRFNALYLLLTGAAHHELPIPYQVSDKPKKYVGLPEQHRRSQTIARLETITTKPLGL
ncbi:MAG: hypothetical protein ACRBB0_11595 [Pelagimonas sp.]|uniref:hypothetical protein n=1 Tax=Pelagimonas sp. TaxID=2073170 RepID=UPI003D6A614A